MGRGGTDAAGAMADAMDDAMAAQPAVVTSSGALRESRRVAAEETMAQPQAVLSGKGSFGSRKQPTLKPTLSRVPSIDVGEPITQDTVLTVEQMFTVLDADKSGGLDMIELKGFVQLLGIKLSEDQVQRMLQGKIKSKVMAGEEPELDLEGFTEFVEPILEEVRETERREAEEAAAADSAPGGLPPGAFETTSLGCLGLDHPARLGAIRLVSQPLFDFVILALIGANSVMMTLEDPLRTEDNPQWMEDAELSFVRAVSPPPSRSGRLSKHRPGLLVARRSGH